jgi:outer membrane receptor protein involved in Fe transport
MTSFTAAQAQTAAGSQSAQGAAAVEEIVVTGSRVVRDGYEAPTPVSVIGAEAFEAAGTPQIADFVNQLPSLSGSQNPTQTAVSSGLQGLAALNLRALGSTRTLVLLDGQRSVPSAVTGQVDVNNIPQALVSRVDIVTGGASAAYGSDALSGVVNFILDKTYTGIKGTVEGGITTYGDDPSWKVNLTAGTPFAGGRGHFLINGEANYTKGIQINDRDWNMQGWKVMVNPSYGTGAGQSTSVPEYLVLKGVAVTSTNGGIIVSGPLKGIAFGPGGTPYQFNYGPVTREPFTQGGDWRANIQDIYTALDSLISAQSAFTRVSYDLSDNVNVFAQASWNRTYAFAADSQQYNVGNILVRADNPFLPASVATRAAQLGVTNFTIGTFSKDLGVFSTDNDRITNRYVVGANGSFEAVGTDWSWDAYYQKGMTRASERIDNTTVNSNFANAIDAARSPNGTIVCRINIDANPANDDPRCVPWNAFGIGVNTQAAKNYITYAQPYRSERFTEDAMSVSMSGEPFSSWAGPVSLALGVEHRKEAVDGVSSEEDMKGNLFVGNFRPNVGEYSVTEGFAETVIPLAVNENWARSLDLNGAVRATDYSVSGYVTTWKLGFTWALIDDIRFRGTKSRDIRAPNLNDLFAAGTANTNGVRDPFNGNAQTQYVGFAVGNTNLKPEIADTTGIGVVLQPTFLDGFSASVDYYKIDIEGAIGTVSAQNIVDLCFAGKQQFCSAITRGVQNGVPVITRILLQPFNFVTERASGLDMEASYRTPISAFVEDWDGNLTIRALATHFISRYINNGINPPNDAAGTNSGSGPPHWRYMAQISYDADPITFSLTARGLSAGSYNNTYIECTTGCPVSTPDNRTISYNRIDGQTWFDMSLAYKFLSQDEDGTDVEAFLTIRNLMNSDPAVYARGPSGSEHKAASYNVQLYDGVGRVFRAGVRFKM